MKEVNQVARFEKVCDEEIRTDLTEVFRGTIRATLELMLEEEMKNLVGSKRYERAAERKGYRNGSYHRGLLTSMGHIEVKVPRSRDGSTIDVLGRYQRRSEDIDALMTEAYVSGVSQRKMGDVTEGLMGKRVSRSVVSRVAKRLEQSVDELRTAKIEQRFPYLYLDATFLDARWARRVENVSALVAYGVGADGHRYLLGVQIGARESEESWSELLKQLVDRGLGGVQLVISDDHKGLKAAVRHWLPEVAHQRCTVHLQRNVLAKVPRRLAGRVVGEVSEIFKAPSKKTAQKRLEDFAKRWVLQLPEAVKCLRGGFEAATQFYAFPEAHWKKLRTTNNIERLNGEIKRRIKSVGAFPDRDSALRLVATVAIRTCAVWGDRRYLDMGLLNKEEKLAA